MDITRCREIVLLAVALAAVTAGPPHAAASRIALAPSSVAAECPVIVTGEIVKIDQFAAKAPDRFGGKTIRLLDVAHIRISQVNKNLLTGVSTKVGQTITARMHPPKGRRIAGVPVMTYCLDLHYKLGTKALWMLYLQEDGHFYINRRPEQRQPVGSYDKIKGRTVDVQPGKPPKPGELAQAFDEKASETGGSVVCENLPSTRVRGEEGQLNTLFSNILSNAIEHGPSGGTVRVTVEHGSDGYCTACIHDEGGGIPVEAIGHLFDRFYRVDSSHSRATGGAGLGLAISREIARWHGGDITIESNPGTGTLVTVRLHRI